MMMMMMMMILFIIQHSTSSTIACRLSLRSVSNTKQTSFIIRLLNPYSKLESCHFQEIILTNMTAYYAIHSTASFAGPAVFFRQEDAQRILSQDSSAVCISLATVQALVSWIQSHGVKNAASTTATEHAAFALADVDGDDDDNDDDNSSAFSSSPNPRKRKAASLPTNGASSFSLHVPLPSLSLLPGVDTSTTRLLPRIVSKREKEWEEKFQNLKTFAETVGDGDPNLAHRREYNQHALSHWIYSQQADYINWKNGKIHDENSTFDRTGRFLKLLELGVRLKSDNGAIWQQQAKKWREYVQAHPETKLTTESTDPTVVELAEWQNLQIKHYVKLMRGESPHEMYSYRLARLKKDNFPFPATVEPPKIPVVKKKTFDERLQEFVEWKNEHKTPLVPSQCGQLGEWVNMVRRSLKLFQAGKKESMKIYLNDEKIQRLKDAGFVFQTAEHRERRPEPKTKRGPMKRPRKTFEEGVQMFVAWKNEHGHPLVPQSSGFLGDWVHSQRRAYVKYQKGRRSRSMTPERILLLQQAGFVFDASGHHSRPAKVAKAAPST